MNSIPAKRFTREGVPNLPKSNEAQSQKTPHGKFFKKASKGGLEVAQQGEVKKDSGRKAEAWPCLLT